MYLKYQFFAIKSKIVFGKARSWKIMVSSYLLLSKPVLFTKEKDLSSLPVSDNKNWSIFTKNYLNRWKDKYLSCSYLKALLIDIDTNYSLTITRWTVSARFSSGEALENQDNLFYIAQQVILKAVVGFLLALTVIFVFIIQIKILLIWLRNNLIHMMYYKAFAERLVVCKVQLSTVSLLY